LQKFHSAYVKYTMTAVLGSPETSVC